MANPDYSKIYQDALRNTQRAATREQEYARRDLLTPAQAPPRDGKAAPMAESNRGKR